MTQRDRTRKKNKLGSGSGNVKEYHGIGGRKKWEMKNFSYLQRSYNSLVLISLVLILISEYYTKRNSDIQKTSFILNTFNFHYP